MAGSLKQRASATALHPDVVPSTPYQHEALPCSHDSTTTPREFGCQTLGYTLVKHLSELSA